jgi:hypothetical protein
MIQGDINHIDARPCVSVITRTCCYIYISRYYVSKEIGISLRLPFVGSRDAMLRSYIARWTLEGLKASTRSRVHLFSLARMPLSGEKVA